LIGPVDIQKKQFTRGVRGYKEEEVDEFLDLLTVELDRLIRENEILKESLRNNQIEVERYRNSENAIVETLESAKGLMSDISQSAEKRAEIVLKNAELDAARIRREAAESVERTTEEAVEIARRWDQFKIRYKNLLQTELDRFDSLSADLIGDPDRTGFYSDDPYFTSHNMGQFSAGNAVSAASPSNAGASAGSGKATGKGKTIKTSKRNGL
jgi:cell division initiation protein